MRKTFIASLFLVVGILSCSGPTEPTPISSISIAASSTTIASGATLQLTAATLGKDGKALTNRVVTWSSSNTNTATVSATGLVTAGYVLGGTNESVTITAAAEGITSTVTVAVAPSPVATVSLTPATGTIGIGATLQLTVTLKDAEGNTLTGRTIAWSASDTTVLLVSASGLVSTKAYLGGAIRTSAITATCETRTAATNISVTPIPAFAIRLNTDTLSLKGGTTARLIATVTDMTGAVLIERPIVWTTTNASVASVSNDGMVSANSYDGFDFKSAKIFATIGAVTTSAEVSVRPSEIFSGYLVAGDARVRGVSYWDNAPVPVDLILRIFQTGHKHHPWSQYSGWAGAVTAGDFNADGYMDVFTAGSACNGMQSRPTFLLWNVQTLRYEEANLFADGTNYLGGPMGIAAAYLNNDNYVDLIIMGHRDECDELAPNEPVRVALSDGMGKYVLSTLHLETSVDLQRFAFEFGAVGDVTGDGLVDLYLTANSHSWIFAGINAPPYFSPLPLAHFASDTVNFPNARNGFGERVPRASEFAFGGRILDVNGDLLNDLVMLTTEDRNAGRSQRVFLNQGGGRFTANGMIQLPYFYDSAFSPSPQRTPHLMDVRVTDVNGDGALDLVGVNQESYLNWNLVAYIKQNDGTYRIKRDAVAYLGSSNSREQYKLRSYLFDLDNDTQKDIGLQSFGIACNNFTYMSAFIRRGVGYLEVPLGTVDRYARWLLTKVQVSPC